MSQSYIGVGLRSKHLEEFYTKGPDIGFIEIHSENYLHCSGIDLEYLQDIGLKYPISMHGIGMSLGSASGVDRQHLESICKLDSILKPFLLSEHLSWSSAGGYFFPDLIPFPFNDESLEVFSKNIDVVQREIGRPLILENPSSYFTYKSSNYSEAEFINLLCSSTGAKILLDVNNIYVSASNNGFDAKQYIDSIDLNLVKEIHISGHSIKDLGDNKRLYIDSHDAEVTSDVWQLYEYALARFGKHYTVLEWDSNLPTMPSLIKHAHIAQKYMERLEETISVT